jgi:MarR family transcriptional regulator for hemolysin
MEHLGYLLADNSRLARRAFDRKVREIGVTGPQARLLLNLNRRPGEKQGYYAEQLEVEPITLCRMVDRLEDANMVERRPDPADRRAWALHLTAKSEKVVEQLQQKIDSLVDEMLGGLTAEERSDFARLLKAVGANLSELRETARIANG